LIPRYTLPEMGFLWSEQAKYEAWKEVEVNFDPREMFGG